MHLHMLCLSRFVAIDGAFIKANIENIEPSGSTKKGGGILKSYPNTPHRQQWLPTRFIPGVQRKLQPIFLNLNNPFWRRNAHVSK
jgi:hypothetical protein